MRGRRASHTKTEKRRQRPNGHDGATQSEKRNGATKPEDAGEKNGGATTGAAQRIHIAEKTGNETVNIAKTGSSKYREGGTSQGEPGDCWET